MAPCPHHVVLSLSLFTVTLGRQHEDDDTTTRRQQRQHDDNDNAVVLTPTPTLQARQR
jgi:hypothetical protein